MKPILLTKKKKSNCILLVQTSCIDLFNSYLDPWKSHVQITKIIHQLMFLRYISPFAYPFQCFLFLSKCYSISYAKKGINTHFLLHFFCCISPQRILIYANFYAFPSLHTIQAFTHSFLISSQQAHLSFILTPQSLTIFFIDRYIDRND